MEVHSIHVKIKAISEVKIKKPKDLGGNMYQQVLLLYTLHD